MSTLSIRWKNIYMIDDVSSKMVIHNAVEIY